MTTQPALPGFGEVLDGAPVPPTQAQTDALIDEWNRGGRNPETGESIPVARGRCWKCGADMVCRIEPMATSRVTSPLLWRAAIECGGRKRNGKPTCVNGIHIPVDARTWWRPTDDAWVDLYPQRFNWLMVLRAEKQCECRGECGVDHETDDGRCLFLGTVEAMDWGLTVVRTRFTDCLDDDLLVTCRPCKRRITGDPDAI